MRRKLLIIAFPFLIVFFGVLWYFAFGVNPADIEIVDYSYCSKERDLLGNFYYEKPVVAKKYSGAEKINRYFEQDCENFFNGKSLYDGENALVKITKLLKDEINENGYKYVIKQPFCYYVETERTFCSEKYISFRQSYVWAAAGPTHVYSNGVTFDLNTGERISFSEFSDMESKLLKENMSKEILKIFENERLRDEIVQMYETPATKDFSIVYNGREIPFNKNFFFDGKNINITLGTEILSHNGLIYQWNIKDINSTCVYTYHLINSKLNKYVYRM